MNQPEALRLADAISNPEGEPDWQTCLRAAAELRRLHFELSEASELIAYQSGRAMDYAGAFMREREANAELVEALGTVIRGVPNTWDGVQKAKVVLDKAKESNHG